MEFDDKFENVEFVEADVSATGDRIGDMRPPFLLGFVSSLVVYIGPCLFRGGKGDKQRAIK